MSFDSYIFYSETKSLALLRAKQRSAFVVADIDKCSGIIFFNYVPINLFTSLAMTKLLYYTFCIMMFIDFKSNIILTLFNVLQLFISIIIKLSKYILNKLGMFACRVAKVAWKYFTKNTSLNKWCLFKYKLIEILILSFIGKIMNFKKKIHVWFSQTGFINLLKCDWGKWKRVALTQYVKYVKRSIFENKFAA